jgi:serine protease AprX
MRVDATQTRRRPAGYHLLATLIASALGLSGASGPGAVTASSYIVQADSAAAASRLVTSVGARIEHELEIIGGVSARLTPAQLNRLRAGNPWVKTNPDAKVQTAGPVLETWYPTLVGAAELHRGGIDGRGVTIAVLDTGLWKKSGTQYTVDQRERIVAQYDVIRARQDPKLYKSGNYEADIDDGSGHGTHVSAIAISSDRTTAGRYQGIAPSANIVAVKAFAADGAGSYADVIAGIDWIVKNRLQYGIRVLNLSFSATPQSAYWEDPLNQAVMQAWQAGIVVIVSAGNAGPDAGTVGVPGNVPYVITVGAMTDSYTPNDNSDDRLATFSSAGPTAEGFVKPEIVAPGGHMVSWMPPHGLLARTYPQFHTEEKEYFTMSGTSQAAGVISGVAALMLQVKPSLTPDQLKCRLMATARPAYNGSGESAYSVLQQGAGLVDVRAAAYSTSSDCANVGLNIGADLANQAHFAGPVRQDDSGVPYLVDELGQRVDGSGYLWSRQSAGNQGYLWSRATILQQGYLWSRTSVFQQGYLWSRGYLWSSSVAAQMPTTSAVATGSGANAASTMAINTWVAPE